MSKPKKVSPELERVKRSIHKITYVILPIAGAALLCADAIGVADIHVALYGSLLAAGVLTDLAFFVIKLVLLSVAAVFMLSWFICSQIANVFVNLFKK